ncbi:MAG TPA: hypothetical protein PJ990_18685 [Saprospiraceae bacterium]|nr:hypothetical protein [Saprospiraceae bacterium]
MIKLIFALALSAVLFSCDSASNKANQPSTSSTPHEDTHEDGEALKLNNGEKWLVNEEMKPFVLQAEDILNQYIISTSEDYLTLAEQLKSKNSHLIKSCTMTGESHDELHKWLHPHMELIASMSDATSIEDANKIIVELQSSFSTYNQYFQ